MMNRDWHLAYAAAFVRGETGAGGSDEELIMIGRDRGLDLRAFKRSRVMPRVRAALSAVKALAPSQLIDIGTGRGAFLWPLLEEMPLLSVLCVEADAARLAPLISVVRGLGPQATGKLEVRAGDACGLSFADGCCDVATLLEVLEHLPDPASAAREALRISRAAVVASVPSREDDNPGHLRTFTLDSFGSLFRTAGARRLKVSEVPGSLICVAWH